jgi:hypothetical protein
VADPFKGGMVEWELGVVRPGGATRRKGGGARCGLAQHGGGGGSLGGQQRRTSGGGGQRLRHGRDGALTSGLGATVPQFKSIQTGQIHFKRNSKCFE